MFFYICQTNAGWVWQSFGHVIEFGNHNGWKEQRHYPGFIFFKHIMWGGSGDHKNLRPPSASMTLKANESSAPDSSLLGVSIAENDPQAQHDGGSAHRLRPTKDAEPDYIYYDARGCIGVFSSSMLMLHVCFCHTYCFIFFQFFLRFLRCSQQAGVGQAFAMSLIWTQSPLALACRHILATSS